MIIDIAPGPIRSILRAFLRARERGKPAGDDSLHHLRLRPEGRWTLGGVQNAKPSRSSRANVEEPSAMTKSLFRNLDRVNYCRALLGNGHWDSLIFGTYEVYNLFRRRKVNRGRAGITPLSHTGIEMSFRH